MYVLNLRALITDLKKHKLSTSDQRKYFWNLFLSYSLFLLLPTIYLLRAEQDLLAKGLIVVQFGLLLVAASFMRVKSKLLKQAYVNGQLSAIAFVQFARLLFLIILRIAMLGIMALLVGATISSLVFFISLYILWPLIAGAILLVFELIFTILINSRLAQNLVSKIKLFFNEQEFSLPLLSGIRSSYISFATPSGICFFCENKHALKASRCINMFANSVRILCKLFIYGFLGWAWICLCAFIYIFLWPFTNPYYVLITLCIFLVLFQLFWLRQVNLALNEVQQ